MYVNGEHIARSGNYATHYSRCYNMWVYLTTGIDASQFPFPGDAQHKGRLVREPVPEARSIEAVKLAATWCNVKNNHLLRSHISCPFYCHALTSSSLWLSNYIHHDMWNEITYPFPNSMVRLLKFEISNFTQHFTGHVITYPQRTPCTWASTRGAFNWGSQTGRYVVQRKK